MYKNLYNVCGKHDLSTQANTVSQTWQYRCTVRLQNVCHWVLLLWQRVGQSLPWNSWPTQNWPCQYWMIHPPGTQCLLQQHHCTGLPKEKNNHINVYFPFHSKRDRQIFLIEVWICGLLLIQIHVFISAAKIRLLWPKMLKHSH